MRFLPDTEGRTLRPPDRQARRYRHPSAIRSKLCATFGFCDGHYETPVARTTDQVYQEVFQQPSHRRYMPKLPSQEAAGK